MSRTLTSRATRRRVLLGAIGAIALPILAACGGSEPPQATPTANATADAKPTTPPAPTPPPPTATTAPTATPRPRGYGMTSPDYSVHVFLWGGFETTDRDLRLVKEMGFPWIKQRFEWRYIEPHVKGKYEWNEPDRIVNAIDRAGLKVIARVDNQPQWTRKDPTWPIEGPPDNLQDFGDFLTDMATRYRGRIQAYQIWNEPNLAREWANKRPDPAQYTEMLKVAHTAIKKADPQAIIISAGLSPTTASGDIAMPDVDFVKQMYASGGKPYFDMLGAHAAGFKAPPETSPEEASKDPRYNHGEGEKGRIYTFRHVEDLRAVMVANGDEAKRVAILEFGWTSDPRPASPYHWHAVSEEEKADFLLRAFDFAKKNWQPWVGAMTVIYIADPTWTLDHEQYHWSITDEKGKIRPAYTALQRLTKDAPEVPGSPTSANATTSGAPVTKPAPSATKPVATP